MGRNLDRRVEAMTPIKNPTVHQQVMDQMMLANLNDNMQSFVTDPTGKYTGRTRRGPAVQRAHYFMTNPSSRGAAERLRSGPRTPKLNC